MYAEISKTVLDEVIQSYNSQSFGLVFKNKELYGNLDYIDITYRNYVRTINDVLNQFGTDNKKNSKIKIIEIGAFLGYVCNSLSKFGFNIEALDLPRVMEKKDLQKKYAQFGVNTKSFTPSKYVLPYESNSLDMIIMCETLEHFNFNPVPLFMEFNRVLKKGGLIYITVPNLVQFRKRINFLKGKPPLTTIEEFIEEVKTDFDGSILYHLKEYTVDELKKIFKQTNFTVTKQYYTRDEMIKKDSLRKKIRVFIYDNVFPKSFKDGITIIAKKENNCDKIKTNWGNKNLTN